MITTAQLDDVPALALLINSAYRGDSSRKGWTTEANLLDGIRIDEASLVTILLNKEETILLYTLDESSEIIGCVHLQPNHNKLYLGMLTVSPEHQAKGIGKQLLSASEAYAREYKYPAIFMTVISIREELIEWYQRHGYLKTGERKPFPMDSKFGLPKRLLEFELLEKRIPL